MFLMIQLLKLNERKINLDYRFQQLQRLFFYYIPLHVSYMQMTSWIHHHQSN